MHLFHWVNTVIEYPRYLTTSEVDLIIHILSNLLEEYEVAVLELEKDMQSQSTPLAMEDKTTTRGPVALIIKLSKIGDRLTRSATGSEDTVPHRMNAE